MGGGGGGGGDIKDRFVHESLVLQLLYMKV